MKKMFIGGRWLAERDERSLAVVNPADGETFDRIACGGAHEVDLAVAAARAALDGAWGRLAATGRGRVLMKIGQGVLDQHRRSLLANPGVAKGPGHAQIRTVPTSGQTAFVVPLDGDRLCNGYLDCHLGARHPSDAGMGQAFQHRARIGAAGVDDTEAR